MTGLRALGRISLACAALGLIPLACGDDESDRDRALAVLVQARGMEPDVAECTLERLDQRGIDYEEIGDGRIDPLQNPAIVEVVATCAVSAAGDSTGG